ncbi:hypothetical protein ACWT_5897 [Actinoplanes sp. SE50]|uniref:hypothetical protein n=1 Tax=unclassified Actinoplanes TaxID=2626549 RepID=UPI00023EBF95|nr:MULTISPECIES: hypothetical protein [unclassified Actinoplanes]AEV86915.1 hypothetical protein ACPL_6028 [Actinoplanes sp. SE50/110]ATO85312.1 hypothetical protein ACWT_5897 [Actinoplanes sp. SE50]SLM02722.1 hypothetical protein ACSP50_6007 [Actinoplanes sp. SE50/110]
MSEITAGERSHDCEQHSRALKRRTITGGTMVTSLGLHFVPWESFTTAGNVTDPTLHGVAVVAGAVFAIDVAISTIRRVKDWAKDRVVVVHLGSRGRPPGDE